MMKTRVQVTEWYITPTWLYHSSIAGDFHYKKDFLGDFIE